MITLRKSSDRGHADHGWLNTYHTFSFGDYMDPAHMGFRSLRVINDDVVKPGMGFGMHPHKNMEIITYVLQGSLQHKDSMGHSEVLKPGEVQRISAGTGILHSEFNPSHTDPVHLLQIWIMPDSAGVTPSYDQRDFSAQLNTGKLVLIASSDGRDGSIDVHQDTAIYAARLREGGGQQRIELADGRHAWVQVAAGIVSVNGVELKTGDGASITGEKALDFATRDGGEVLVFNLA